MSVIHGKGLVVTMGGTPITDVTSHTANETTNPAPFVTSNTSGSTSRVAGATDATGSVTALGSVVQAALVKGSTGTLVLKSSSGDTVFSGAVLMGDSSFSVNSQGIPTYTANWGKT